MDWNNSSLEAKSWQQHCYFFVPERWPETSAYCCPGYNFNCNGSEWFQFFWRYGNHGLLGFFFSTSLYVYFSSRFQNKFRWHGLGFFSFSLFGDDHISGASDNVAGVREGIWGGRCWDLLQNIPKGRSSPKRVSSKCWLNTGMYRRRWHCFILCTRTYSLSHCGSIDSVTIS